MAKLRLVAYRKESVGVSAVKPYELDLQKEPNISVNYQFDDIKNPETKKASFSQTFKLPFTDRNNEFFQNWYEVNLQKLVYNTRTKFDAILYYGTTSQFEGLLQLKSVHEKAGTYEVSIASTVINLFNVIGENKLKDVFKNDDGTYSEEWNHLFTYTDATNNTLYNSWAGTLTNKSGVSLQDTDAGVSKVLYPLSFTMDGGYFKDTVNAYMNMSDPTNANNPAQKATPMQQFRPALQLKALFNLIFAKSGFSYTSAFIDGTGIYASEKYFSKLFMTTGSDLETAHPAVENDELNPDGFLFGGSDEQWGTIPVTATSTDCAGFDYAFTPFVADNFGNGNYLNPDGTYDATYNTITRVALNMDYVQVQFYPQFSNCAACGNSTPLITAQLVRWNETTNAPDQDTVYWSTGQFVNPSSSDQITFTFDLYQMPVGTKAIILISPFNVRVNNTSLSASLTLGYYLIQLPSDFIMNNWYSSIQANFTDNLLDIYGSNVDVPACIPDTITQKAFLKDIIQRFNLIVTTDPNDPNKLILEPYNDYIGSGSTKFWTDKLDTEKEIIISDTTSLQKRTINLTDLDDEDLMNKAIREDAPTISVLGKLQLDEVINEFASGELKNDSLFSPFINQKVGETPTSMDVTDLKNMAVHYEIGYDTDNSGVTLPKLSNTKPKLFYYCGTPTSVTLDVDTSSPSTASYYLHIFNLVDGIPVPKEFTKYPVCTAWDIVPNGTSHQYTLTSSNKSLYWGFAPPAVPDLTIFNYQPSGLDWTSKTLYFEYWKKYLDNLYNEDARILECYLNLDATDIFDFSFSDEIFIRDSYWRIIKIQNYQIGSQASTKVTLLKVLDTVTYTGDYVLSDIMGSNLAYGAYWLFCPTDGTACGGGHFFVDEASCYAYGGTPATFFDANAPLYPCLANTGSLPISVQSFRNAVSFYSQSGYKSLTTNKFAGNNKVFVMGTNNGKYSQPIMPQIGNDIIIKHSSNNASKPQINGEIHRIALSGYTEGTTKGYAYVQGDSSLERLKIPTNSNMMIRVNAIVSVVGSTNSSYPVGTTESVSYYTGFKNIHGAITQIGTIRGVQEFSITEGGVASSCTLEITENNTELEFALVDSQNNTFRAWSLSVELNVQELPNIANGGYNVSYALWQNAGYLYFQNDDNLIWN